MLWMVVSISVSNMHLMSPSCSAWWYHLGGLPVWSPHLMDLSIITCPLLYTVPFLYWVCVLCPFQLLHWSGCWCQCCLGSSWFCFETCYNLSLCCWNLLLLVCLQWCFIVSGSTQVHRIEYLWLWWFVAGSSLVTTVCHVLHAIVVE